MNFFQGEAANLYLTILDGSQPVNAGVSGTTVDVYHFVGPSLITDVVSGTMTNQSAPFQNVWFYNYNVPSGAALTAYNVVYNTIISGTPYQATEVFNVLPATTIGIINQFSGSVSASGTVVNPSGVPIANVGVSFASGSTIVTSTTTNISGVYYANLNPQNYYTTFAAAGYFTNQFLMTIPSGTTAYLGLTTLTPFNIGSLTISDTLVTLDSYGNPVPLSNIKVTLWSIDGVAGGTPLGTTFTNVSGTFFLNANEGNYILQMAGMDVNYNRYNQTRNIEVNSVYNFPPTGPWNYQYGDTSSYNFT
jgi:hypothetical protein